MGCVQNKNTLKNAKSNTANNHSTQQASRMQAYVVKQSGHHGPEQGVLSETHLSDEQNHKANNNINRTSHSQKQTQIDPNTPEVEDNNNEEHDHNNESPQQQSQSPQRQQKLKSRTAVPTYYPVTLEYVLARKSFVESQHISQDQRLNMFPAPKLKAVSKSSLIHRRKLSQGQQAQIPLRCPQQRKTSKI